MKFTRRPWGVFKRAYDPTYKGRGREILISTHKTSFTANRHCGMAQHVRRLTTEERNPNVRRG